MQQKIGSESNGQFARGGIDFKTGAWRRRGELRGGLTTGCAWAWILPAMLLAAVPILRSEEPQPVAQPATAAQPAAAQPVADDLVIDDGKPAAPATAPVTLNADDLAKLPPPAEQAHVPVPPPGKGDQEVNLEVSVPANCTVQEAITHVFAQLPALMPEYTWASNDLERLRTAPAGFATPSGKTMRWDEALLELLKPEGLDFIEDGRLVRLGPADMIEDQRANLAQDRLARNHKKIVVAFDGQALKFVLENIQSQAGISMNYNYMDAADLNPVVVAPPVAVADAGQPKTAEDGLSADVLQAQAAAQAASPSRKVTYSTPPGMPQEWRMVLREVLDPCGYDFIEVGGVVRPMPRAKIVEYRAREINERPVAVRVVRVYHADPKEIIERLQKMPGILKHAQAFMDITRGDGSFSKRFTGSGVSATSSGGGTTIGGMVSDSSNYGSMDRPRTPPGVVIGDIASNLDAIEDRIRALDVRERQVVIEAKIFEVGADIDRKLGVNWQNFGGRGSFTSGVSWVSTVTRTRTDDDEHGDTQSWDSEH
ncbi:MAG: hypothetical protein PHR35_21325, partial [Kiritimatiellae bacterium]|nr:hypothetical protein [Kiritimatiellia bacterium]